MSGPPSNWLKAQKKADLAELAQELGIEDYEGLRKPELEVALDDFLRENSTTYAADSRFRTFYKRRYESSPVKNEVSAALFEAFESKGRMVKRRATKATEELTEAITGGTPDSEISSAPITTRTRALARTPRATTLSLASQVPLPPSPAVVADAIDRNTAIIRSKVSDYISRAGISERVELARETLSSVHAITSLSVLLELYQLRKLVLPDRHAFSIPHSLIPGRWSDYHVQLPDLFNLVTSAFWGPTLLWAATTLLVPLTASYFFNLTGTPRQRSTHARDFAYDFDPLTFHVVKALVVYLVFGRDLTVGGLVDLESVAWINDAMYAGWQSVVAGSAIGVLVTLYEAVLTK